jgi:hypothetical protein
VKLTIEHGSTLNAYALESGQIELALYDEDNEKIAVIATLSALQTEQLIHGLTEQLELARQMKTV